MINENELAKELTDAMGKDPVPMPKVAALKANGGATQPTISDDVDRLIARLHSTIKGFEMLKAQLLTPTHLTYECERCKGQRILTIAEVLLMRSGPFCCDRPMALKRAKPWQRRKSKYGKEMAL